jgi:hypothetical protein
MLAAVTSFAFASPKASRGGAKRNASVAPERRPFAV